MFTRAYNAEGNVCDTAKVEKHNTRPGPWTSFSPARRRSARFICYWSISLSVMVESYQLNYLWLAFLATSTTWSHPPQSSRPVSEAPPKSDYEDDCPPRSSQLSPDSSFEAYEYENSVAVSMYPNIRASLLGLYSSSVATLGGSAALSFP